MPRCARPTVGMTVAETRPSFIRGADRGFVTGQTLLRRDETAAGRISRLPDILRLHFL